MKNVASPELRKLAAQVAILYLLSGLGFVAIFGLLAWVIPSLQGEHPHPVSAVHMSELVMSAYVAGLCAKKGAVHKWSACGIATAMVLLFEVACVPLGNTWLTALGNAGFVSVVCCFLIWILSHYLETSKRR